MSILETFYILFKSDTSDIKKGSDEALKTTKKLNESLKETDETSEKLGVKFFSIVESIAGLLTGFASLHAVISGFKNTVDYDIDLGKTSRALGVNVEQLDAWDYAVRQAGGTAEGFQNSLKNLAEHFNTNPSVALKFLPQLADVFSKISRFSAFKLGKSLGLDEATILLLQQGRREVEAVLKQQRELGVVSKEDIEITTKYNKSLMNLEHGFRTLYNMLINSSLPGFTKFFDILTKGLGYLTIHKDLVIGAIIGIAAAAVSAAFAFNIVSFPIIRLISLVTVLIGLFALLWEDNAVRLRGGKSLIGEYLDEWKRAGIAIDNIIKKWGNELLDFMDKFKLLKPISDYLRSHDNSFVAFQKTDEGKKFLSFVSQSPINSTPSNVVNSSLFNKDHNIHIGEINMEIQSNDAQGVAYGLRAELQKIFSVQMDQSSGNFSDNVHA
jgi:hypothetical protein